MASTNYTGADLSGSDGGTNRILTHTNTFTDSDLIFIAGRLLHPTLEYTTSGATATIITAVFDNEVITVVDTISNFSSTTNYLGSDLTLTDGVVNRVLTHTDTIGDNDLVLIGGRLLHPTLEYTTSDAEITFLVEVFDTDNITLWTNIVPTTTYTTSLKVSELLQTETYTSATTPTATQVDDFINRMEDKIDKITGHAWRTVSVSTEYHEPYYQRGFGNRIDLAHRSIKALTSGTDTLEVWDGNTWNDYVATKTEGRGDDYFVDVTNGVIWVNKINRFFPRGVRLSYRYGESTVNQGIEDVCTKMVAIEILNMLDSSARFIDDGPSNRLSHGDRIREWKEDIDDTLMSYKEIRMFIQN